MPDIRLTIHGDSAGGVRATKELGAAIHEVKQQARSAASASVAAAREQVAAEVQRRREIRLTLVAMREVASQAKRGSDEQIAANKLAAKSAAMLGETYKAVGVQAQRAMRQASEGGFGQAATRDEKGLKRGFASKVTGIGGFLAGPGFIAGAVGGIATMDILKETLASQDSQKQLQNALANSGISWAKNREEINAVLDRSMKLSGFNKNDLRESFALLVRSTGSQTSATRLLSDAYNVARGRHMDLQAASVLLTRAWEGNVGSLRRLGVDVSKVSVNMDALRAAHIKVTDANRAQVAMLVAHAKALDATATRTALLNKVEHDYHGAAVARSRTLQGRLDDLHNTVRELMVTLGTKMIPIMTRVVTWMDNTIQAAERSKRVHDDLRKAINDVRDAFEFVAPKILAVVRIIRDLTGYLLKHHDLLKVIIGAWVAWKGAMVITSTVNKVKTDLASMRDAWLSVHDAVVKVLQKVGLIGKSTTDASTAMKAPAAEMEATNASVAGSAETAATAESSIGAAATADVAEVTTAATAIEADNAAIAASADAAAGAEAGIGAAAAAGAAGITAGVGAVVVGGALATGFAVGGLSKLFGLGDTQLARIDMRELVFANGKFIIRQRGASQPISVQDAFAILSDPSAKLTKAGSEALDKMLGTTRGGGTVTATQAGIVRTAMKVAQGPYSRYVYGGGGAAGPSDSSARHDSYHFKGFDCSGFVQYVMAQNGIKVPRTSQAQAAGGVAVPPGQLAPGDLVFTEGWPHPGHVGIYIGDGKVIEDPHTGASIRVTSLADFGVTGARRYYATGQVRVTGGGTVPKPGGRYSGQGREGTAAPAADTPPVVRVDSSLAKQIAAAKTAAEAAAAAAKAAKAAKRGRAGEATVLSAQDDVDREIKAALKIGDVAVAHALESLRARIKDGIKSADLAVIRVHMREYQKIITDAMKATAAATRKSAAEQKAYMRELAKYGADLARAQEAKQRGEAKRAADDARARVKSAGDAFKKAWTTVEDEMMTTFDRVTQKHLQDWQQQVSDHIQAMQDAFQDQMTKFDRQTQAGLQRFVVARTPQEKALADFLKKRQQQEHDDTMKGLQDALTQAQAGGDPQAIKQAQDALNSQLLDDQQQALQDQADASRKAQDAKTQRQQDAYQQARDRQRTFLERTEQAAEQSYQREQDAEMQNYQDQRDIQRIQLQAQLDDLGTHLAARHATWDDANKALADLMSQGGSDVGSAFVAGLQQAFADAGLDYQNFTDALNSGQSGYSYGQGHRPDDRGGKRGAGDGGGTKASGGVTGTGSGGGVVGGGGHHPGEDATLPKHSTGGWTVPGADLGRDTVKALLEPGEYVMSRQERNRMESDAFGRGLATPTVQIGTLHVYGATEREVQRGLARAVKSGDRTVSLKA